jgi:hypothetical protein
VLAAVLGTALAGHARQLTAAVLVAVFASANGLFFLVADILPGTVPLGVAAAVVVVLEWRGARTRGPRLKSQRLPALRGATGQPGIAQPMEA